MQSPDFDSEDLAVSSVLPLTSLVPVGKTPTFSGLLALYLQNGYFCKEGIIMPYIDYLRA